MTEKLRELAVKAGLIAGESNGFDRTKLTPAELRFAHSIINACVSAIEQEADEWDAHTRLVFKDGTGFMTLWANQVLPDYFLDDVEDSVCPCGADGGTSCGSPSCYLLTGEQP